MACGNGDKIDCYVTSLGAASSIKGGRLFPTLMTDPAGKVIWAQCEGPIDIQDVKHPDSGMVKLGCVMEVDIEQKYFDDEWSLEADHREPRRQLDHRQPHRQDRSTTRRRTGDETLATAEGPEDRRSDHSPRSRACIPMGSLATCSGCRCQRLCWRARRGC